MATMTTDELLDVFKNMTVLELNEFLKAFEEEFGVTAAAPVAVPRPPAAAGGGEAAGCRGAGRVRRHPHAAGDKKIQVIKEVRSLTASVSKRPRTSSTARPSRSSRRSPRKRPTRPRRSSKRPAPVELK